MSGTVVTLDQLTPADESRSGAKASNCARLKRAGFPVPDALVVLSTASDAEVAVVLTHSWFDTLPADTVFAVRSSGIGEDSEGQSFAGIHETRLNVRRGDDVRDAVLACRASARSEGAMTYRRARGLSTDEAEIAVLVQRMIQPVAAGVAFTIDPVSGATDQIVINSSWGLGEALVSGQVDPDEFHVRKLDGEIVSSRVGDKGTAQGSSEPSLTPSHLRELATTLAAIEREYGEPQDVEWCHDGARVWIVQSRPVTGTRVRRDETEWTRANLAEVLPEITSPQALAACEWMLNQGHRQHAGRIMAPEAMLGPMVRAFHGRLYFNVSQLRHVSAMAGTPPATVLRSLGHAGDLAPEDEKPPRVTLRRVLVCLPDMARILAQHLRVAALVRRQERRVREALARVSAADPRSLTDAEVWSVIDEAFREAPRNLGLVFLLGSVFAFERPVRKICERVGFPFERLLYSHLAAGERSVSAQQAFDLVALATVARRDPLVVTWLDDESLDPSTLRTALGGTIFVAELDRFLERYGHRGRYESDWSLPRYREDPTPLLQALRAHVQSGSDEDVETLAERQKREAAEVWQAFEGRLTCWQRWTALPRVRGALRRIKRYYVWREKCRSDLMRGSAVTRQWHLVLADRFVERGWLDARDQYFLLRLEEIAGALTDGSTARGLRAIALERAREIERYRKVRMPLLMRESELPALIRRAGITSGSTDERVLQGLAVSGGSVEAEVVVLHDPGDFALMKRGAILVARATDPSWTPLFTLASGIIVEVGGVLSHASTIAREYGLPALANVKDATRRLKTGERIRLDADSGAVYRLSATNSSETPALPR